jgi:hypothetical protein
LSSRCCLPLLPFVLAAGTAGSSAFFVKLRPFLVSASVLFIAFGFLSIVESQTLQMPT